MDKSLNFFSLAAFQTKYNLQVQLLTFFGLISAVNRLRRQNTKTQSKCENRFSKFLMGQKPSKFIYQEIVSKTVKGQFHVKKSGAKHQSSPQRKLLIGKSLIKHLSMHKEQYTYHFQLQIVTSPVAN